MADYLATPQIQEDGLISLYGKTYRIKGKVRVSQATQWPAKLNFSTVGTPEDDPLLSHFTVSDLTGGMGLLRYRDIGSQLTRYWTAQNFDGLWPNAITLGPLVTSLGHPSDSMTLLPDTITVFMASSGLTDVVNYQGSVYTHNGTTWVTPSSATLAGITTGGIIGTVMFNGRLFFPDRASGYHYLTSAVSASIDVAAPLVASFIVWDSKLYCIDTAGVLYVSTTGSSGSWTTLAALSEVGVNVPHYELAIYYNTSFDPTIYCLANTALWSYDATNDIWYQVMPFPYIDYVNVPLHRTRTNYRGVLIIQTNKRRLLMLQASFNQMIVTDITPGLPDGPSAEYAGVSTTAYITDSVATTQHFFAYVNAADSNTIAVLCFNEQGWHPIFYFTGGSLGGGITGLGISSAGSHYRLYLHDSGMTVGWIDLDSFIISPLVSTARKYAISGFVTLPWFDAEYEAQTKTAIDLRVKVQGLTTGSETVRIDYATDFGTSFTQLGSTITSSTPGITSGRGEITLPFGTNNVGLAFKTIQFKITLASGGSTNAPKIEYISLDFYRNPDILKGFLVTVDMTEEIDNRSPRQQQEDLWTAIGTPTLGTFAYRDDAGDTRSYLCKVMRPEGQENTGHDESSVYNVYVPTFGPN